MPRPAFPDREPVTVTRPDGSTYLAWLDPSTGEPGAPIGVEREFDVPGISTPGAVEAIHALPLAKQLQRQWPGGTP